MFVFYPKSHQYELELDKIVDKISNCHKNDPSLDHINQYPLPSREIIISILNDLFDILFPGYFTDKEINAINLKHFIGNKIHNLFEKLVIEISKSLSFDQNITSNDCCELCNDSMDRSIESALYLLENISRLKELLTLDVKAGYDGDPAAQSIHEIIFSYPGLYAITVHRIAHLFYEKEIALFPRIMSEHAHSITGIDIHPGANIGQSFFIDHGTGVVIGETTEIGNHVKIYQGVTLGALSIPKDERGKAIKGIKRHPKIEDQVTIYSGTTILGGKTVIGKKSIIGGNLWITSSIPPYSKVILSKDQTKFNILQNSRH